MTSRRTIRLEGVPEIFACEPPTDWLCESLQLAPGRPAILAGYGASAKSWLAMHAALSVASGRPLLGTYGVRTGAVLHLDYEQGGRATRKRYRRLAAGHKIGPQELGNRLDLASLPELRLSDPDAAVELARLCDGRALLIIDSLRAATAGMDENSSDSRHALDILTRIAEQTGCASLVVHHASKPRDNHTDPRMILRGSSSIFDAAGSVMVVDGPTATKEGPRRVRQVKSPADAEGPPVAAFGFALRDVDAGGLIVEPVQLPTADAEQARVERVYAVIRDKPGIARTAVSKAARMNRSAAKQAIDSLIERGFVAPSLVGATERLGITDVPLPSPASDSASVHR